MTRRTKGSDCMNSRQQQKHHRVGVMEADGKMHILLDQTGFESPSNWRRRRRPLELKLAHHLKLVTCCLILSWCQLRPASALYLQQPMILSNNQQQQQAASPGMQVPDNGAIMQALSQFAIQQMASGGLNGGLQVTATSTPTGGISISNNNSNNNNNNNNNGNQQVALVSSNANANNQTAPASLASTSTGQQQQQAGSGSGSINSNQFVIKFLHNDSKNQLAYVSITPVNYTNLHEPRIELRYQSKYPYVSLAESSPNNTVVAAVIVNDEDSGPSGETSLAIEQGNELGHFKLVSTSFTNTIQVNGAPLSKHLRPEYNLTIVARDHGSPPKASSSTLVIKLHASPMHSSSSLASHLPYSHSQQQAQYNPNSPLESMPSLKPPVTDLMYVGTMLVVMFSAVIILIIIGCALVQRPTQKGPKPHKGPPPTRTTSATNSRIVPPGDQCSAYCLTSGYDLSNLNIN